MLHTKQSQIYKNDKSQLCNLNIHREKYHSEKKINTICLKM